MSEHEPLPWRIRKNGVIQSAKEKAIEYGGIAIATCWVENAWDDDPDAIANAEFIVEAVNNYERLLQENERLRNRIADLEREREQIIAAKSITYLQMSMVDGTVEL